MILKMTKAPLAITSRTALLEAYIDLSMCNEFNVITYTAVNNIATS